MVQPERNYLKYWVRSDRKKISILSNFCDEKMINRSKRINKTQYFNSLFCIFFNSQSNGIIFVVVSWLLKNLNFTAWRSGESCHFVSVFTWQIWKFKKWKKSMRQKDEMLFNSWSNNASLNRGIHFFCFSGPLFFASVNTTCHYLLEGTFWFLTARSGSLPIARGDCYGHLAKGAAM